ncbi:MAG: ankyrin repeat domain-containing protein [Puniceicoccales bacterium]|nr:ankyrin repeat domain-containing protein [Puniceicoccales bacterium]
MKNKYTKKLLIGMVFLSFGLHSNSAQALFSRKPFSISCQGLDDLGHGRWFWKKPTQFAYINQFVKMTPQGVLRILSEAVQNRKPGTVQKILLLNRICFRLDDVSSLLHTAVRNNDFLTLAALVSAEYRDENGNKKSLCDINYEHNGRTPIMLAIEYGQVEMVDFLLSEGADLFKASPNGTILHLAIRLGNFKLAMEIIRKINDQHSFFYDQPNKRKQFFNQVDRHGKTIFHIACEEFIKGKLSPTLFSSILFWSEDYDVIRDNTKNRELRNDIEKILSQLRTDRKWYKIFKNFKLDKRTRENVIQMLEKMHNHIHNAR